jgi:hypothetical protein
MLRDLILTDLRDVATYRMIIMRIVGRIGCLAVLVPLTRENAPATDRFESAPQAADSGEKVNERECRCVRDRLVSSRLSSPKTVKDSLSWRLSLAIFPPVDVSLVISERLGSFHDRQASLLPQDGKLGHAHLWEFF